MVKDSIRLHNLDYTHSLRVNPWRVRRYTTNYGKRI